MTFGFVVIVKQSMRWKWTGNKKEWELHDINTSHKKKQNTSRKMHLIKQMWKRSCEKGARQTRTCHFVAASFSLSLALNRRSILSQPKIYTALSVEREKETTKQASNKCRIYLSNWYDATVFSHSTEYEIDWSLFFFIHYGMFFGHVFVLFRSHWNCDV